MGTWQETIHKELKHQKNCLKTLFAKSLIVFVGIGVVSGLVFGLYLFEIKNTGQVVFVEGPSISIVTEKSDFEQGETISINIINSGGIPLNFSDATYGLRITGLSGILMYSPTITPNATADTTHTPYVLEPGAEVDFVWDQIKNNGNAALEGLYKITAMGNDGRGNTIERSTIITILK